MQRLLCAASFCKNPWVATAQVRVPIGTSHAKSLCKHIFVLPSGLSPKDLTPTACLLPKGTASACHNQAFAVSSSNLENNNNSEIVEKVVHESNWHGLSSFYVSFQDRELSVSVSRSVGSSGRQDKIPSDGHKCSQTEKCRAINHAVRKARMKLLKQICCSHPSFNSILR